MTSESARAAHPTRRTRRTAAIGATAGLLGGGAVGLMLTVPSASSAATDDGSGDTSVVQIDEPADDGITAPGTWLRESLQELVDDGTISDEQADAVTGHLVAAVPERGEGRVGRLGDRREQFRERRGGFDRERLAAFDGEVVADLIGIDVETFRSELRDGASIAEIATDEGVDPQIVIDALVDEASDHLALAVEDDRLTEEEAANRLGELGDRIADRVNGTRPDVD